MPGNRAPLFQFILMLGLISLIPQSLSSQEYNFTVFGEDEGLPSEDVYDMRISQDGFLWFATDNGVSRYDGYDFMNLDVSDGLPLLSIIKLYEDIFGRLWFLSYNGTLSYYQNGIITPYKYNDTILKYFPDNFFQKILVDSTGGIMVSPRWGGQAYLSSEGHLRANMDQIPYQTDSCYLSFEPLGDDYFMTIVSNTPDHCNGWYPLFNKGDHYFLSVEYYQREFQRNYIQIDENEFIVSYRNIAYYIKSHRVIRKYVFEEEVLSMFLDQSNNLWISIKFDHGLYKFLNENLDGTPQQFLRGYTVTNMVQDHESNYWISTEGSGVFFIPGFDFRLFKLPDDNRNLNVMALNISGNRLWFSTRDKELYSGMLFDGRISNIRRIPISEPFNWIEHIAIDKDGYIWLPSTPELRYDPAGFPHPPDTVVSATCLGQGQGDTIIVASRMFSKYVKGKLVYGASSDSVRRIYTVYQGCKNQIWLGTLYGLYVLENNKFKYIGNSHPYLAERISAITKMRDMLIVGTASKGILCMHNDSIKYMFNTDSGLSSNSVKSLFAQNDSVLWAGTKDGLNKIIFEENDTNYRIETYRYSDGLPSGQINEIKMHNGFIWLATASGLVSFDPDQLSPNRIPPIIRITGVQINGEDTTLLDHYDLDYDQNDIRISYSGLTYRSGNNIMYRYLMYGLDDEIVFTKNNWANFPNMPAGDYTFMVNIGNEYGIWNKAPLSFTLSIRKHFSEASWFMVLIIILSSASIVFLSMYLQQQRKNKERARLELAQVEQKMFRSQMNPHFVFNALLAIQGFMYDSNTKDAGRYLTSFAKLIRHTLYGANEELVTLENEIEAMKYYLELQRLRFNEKFDYFVELDETVLPEAVYIPPLLIQPFLENAIEHGLQHLTKPGILKMIISGDKDCLMIRIEDNGIGREKAMQMNKNKRKLHKSMGMDIVRKRISSLQMATGMKISLEIIDLKNIKDEAIGTQVRICIPYRSKAE